MKTERVTLLTTPDFKAFLNSEAASEGVSVAELVRRRCECRPSEEENVLAELTNELRGAVKQAKASLQSGLDEAAAVLTELRSTGRGSGAHANVTPRPVRRKGARR